MKTVKDKQKTANGMQLGLTLKRAYKSKYLYLLMLPAIIHLLMFEYRGMYGILIAFKDFNPKLGVTGSEWIGFKHFKGMFNDPYFWHIIINTIRISFGRMIVTFPFDIILALCFNELRQRHLKKTLQTVYTFPHFLSWVITSGVILNFLDYTGPLNSVIAFFGGERQVLMGNNDLILPILYFTDVWKEAGWGCIIYLAAITGVDAGLYEAAELDGASHWQQTWHITLPSIRSTILIMLTMKVGSILSGGFDQIFNLSNPVVQKTVDILDTYIHRITFQQAPDFSYSTAVGLFKSLVGFMMVMSVNKITQKLEGTGILE